MRAIFLFFILVSFPFISTGQEAQADSIQIFNYEDGYHNLSYVFEYPSADSVIRKEYRIDSSGQRNLRETNLFVYNENGDLIEKDRGYWRDNYTYDEDYNLTGFYRYRWDSNGENFEPWEGTEYLEFDEFGNHRQARFLFANAQSNGWYYTGYNLHTHVYNSDNLLDTLRVFDVDAELLTTTTYEYDTEGRISKELRYSDVKMEEVFEGVYTYNMDGLLVEREHLCFDTWTDNPFGPCWRYNFIYDQDQRLDFQKTEIYNNGYTDYADWQYFYPNASSVASLVVEGIMVNWTNTSLGKIDLSIEGLDADEKYVVGIVNMQGQRIKSLVVEGEHIYNNSYRLESGTYVLIVKDQMNRSYTEQIIVI